MTMRINRRSFLAGSAFALPTMAAHAQRPDRPWRIGYLAGGTSPDGNISAFKLGMRRLGRLENQDFVLIVRFAEFRYERFADLIDELLAEKVEIIVTGGPATRAAPIAAKSVPVVFGFSGDPVAAGVVRSLARPGTNTTGMSALALELAGKRLSLLAEAAPRVRRVAVLSNPNHAGEQSEWAATRAAGEKLGIELNYFQIPGAPEIARALEAAESERCEGLLTFPEAVSLFNRGTIAEFAARRGMPSLFGWKIYCEAGGLMSYGPNLQEFYAGLAVFVDRILRGTPANDLPVELPTKIEMIANLGTARTIGLTLPDSILARVDEVLG